MTGSKPDIKLVVTKLKGFSFADKEIGDRNIFEIKAEEHGRTGSVPEDRLVFFMKTKGDIVCSLHGIYAKYMVEVCMGIDDCLRHEIIIGNIGNKMICLRTVIHARIYNPALFFVVDYEISVFLESVERELLDI